MGHDPDDVVEHLGLIVVEGDELVMALERLVVPAVGIAPEPPGGGRAGAPGQRGLERRERTADMIEHAVQDDPQAAPAGGGDQMVEVLLVA